MLVGADGVRSRVRNAIAEESAEFNVTQVVDGMKYKTIMLPSGRLSRVVRGVPHGAADSAVYSRLRTRTGRTRALSFFPLWASGTGTTSPPRNEWTSYWRPSLQTHFLASSARIAWEVAKATRISGWYDDHCEFHGL